MAKIDWALLPTRAVLKEVSGLNLEQLSLPKNYAGRRSTKWSALSLLTKLENNSFSEILLTEPSQTSPNWLTYAGFHLFALNPEDAYHGWVFYDVFKNGQREPTTDKADYVVYLASNYAGPKLERVIDAVSAIINQQLESDATITLKTVELPTVADLGNLFNLAQILHDEGIVMSTRHLWIASKHWTSEMVLQLIEEGMPILKALQLYQMGFTTIEEMQIYDEMIPEEWMLRILGDGNDDDVFDYSF